MTETTPRLQPLKELALLFLRLGITAFGGPAAHIAMMEDEVVRRRQWLTRDEFLDLLGATNLIPGPNSTEMAIHLGRCRAGWMGLLVAGASFILPAAIIVTGIAWAYVRYGKLPEAQGILYGMKPVIVAIVVQALWRLGGTALKSRLLVFLAAVAAALNLAGVNELIVLFGIGILPAVIHGMGLKRKSLPTRLQLFLWAGPAVPLTTAVSTAGVTVPFSLWGLFLFFLKVGSVLFGSGYVLLAFLRSDLVERWRWLTESQLLDAIAVGQFTPGPVFTTATFIGYILGGPIAAAVATIGIFLPAFLFVAMSGPLIPKLRSSPVAGAFLDGVNVASLALMAVVTLQLGAAALVDWFTALLGAVSALLLFRFHINSAWLVLGGGIGGFLWLKV
ncbi:MAG: chromate efflux transporter [Verrucomicrobia bacterium]|nr:chromate efflux transporter [Verrucomicrobiota bacterium]